MRHVSSIELAYVSGGTATPGDTDGCPPKRRDDVINCPQTSAGNLANDIANFAAELGRRFASLFG